ncbi:MAG: homogentisate phytyltransferase [Acaryochloridaceae cyanobacterium CSU_3_4]|nr:homogentisate phytyltransferase [Acaryochloris sp. SU_5_25]NJN38108.1 homogentisate phytyltransferase [Acaryochloridaceae cyanobacterium CSU_3_4]
MHSSLKSNPRQKLRHWLRALWKFSRPHTIIGTSLSVVGLALVALSTFYRGTDLFVIAPAGSSTGWFYGHFFWLILAALVPSLCANVYIVGLNQLTDIAIDRINKPQLPLASGEFSRKQGVWIIRCTGLLAVGLAVLQSYFLLLTVGLSLLIGTIYSIPPIRLKRFPFWAALCIFGVRGIVVNIGFFLHFRQQLGGTGAIPLKLWVLTGFVILFAFAIAIFKDIPDQDGDRQFQIRTLTVRLGSQAVFNLAVWVLTACYLGVVGIVIVGLPAVHTEFLGVTHLGLCFFLWYRSLQVEITNHRQVTHFYQWIWKLFFLEYLLFPVACLWS